jgi:hypothetical protein
MTFESPEKDRGRSAGREPESEPELEWEPEPEPEDLPDEPGAEGGSKSPAADTPPAFPSKDDSELGDTDQHSAG